MEAPDGALISEDKQESPSLALKNSAELSTDVIADHMQDIALEGKESGGDIDSIKDMDNEDIEDQENSDSIGTADIDSTVENEGFFYGCNSSKSYAQFKNFLS